MSGLNSFKNRNVLVIGASRGIGLEIANTFAELGANVTGTGRGTGRSANPPSVRWTYVRADAVKFSEDFFDQHGPFDALVYCAGITLPQKEASFLNWKSADLSKAFDETMAVNVRGALLTAVAFAQVAVRTERQNASVTLITSIGAHQGFANNPSYVASKGALLQLARALAVDFGTKGIRVNTVAPGYTHTSMTEASFSDPIRRQARERQTILGRFGEPKDIVGAVVYLASDAATYVTGSEIVVDGGWLAKGMIE